MRRLSNQVVNRLKLLQRERRNNPVEDVIKKAAGMLRRKFISRK